MTKNKVLMPFMAFIAFSFLISNANAITYTTNQEVCGSLSDTTVQVNPGVILRVCDYNGTANTGYWNVSATTINIYGTINATGSGYRGGASVSTFVTPNNGEGLGGGMITYCIDNGNGNDGSTGSGGGFGGIGGRGYDASSSGSGSCATFQDSGFTTPGPIYGNATDLSVYFGSGGSGGSSSDTYNSECGGDGGGAVVLNGTTININGTIDVTGLIGCYSGFSGISGGGGSGGTILIYGNTIYSDFAVLNASGGSGQEFLLPGPQSIGESGGGGGGRIKIFYSELLSNNSAQISVLKGFQNIFFVPTSGPNGENGTFAIMTFEAPPEPPSIPTGFAGLTTTINFVAVIIALGIVGIIYTNIRKNKFDSNEMIEVIVLSIFTGISLSLLLSVI